MRDTRAVDKERLVRVEVEGDEREQHEDGASERIEEELDGRVLLARAAPDTDEEVHRQQHDLPEHVKEEEIERDEDAHHPGDEQAVHGKIALELLLDAEARHGTDESNERREQ